MRILGDLHCHLAPSGPGRFGGPPDCVFFRILLLEPYSGKSAVKEKVQAVQRSTTLKTKCTGAHRQEPSGDQKYKSTPDSRPDGGSDKTKCTSDSPPDGGNDETKRMPDSPPDGGNVETKRNVPPTARRTEATTKQNVPPTAHRTEATTKHNVL